MSQVQLQVRPRRVRCTDASEPPPFRFAAGTAPAPKPTAGQRVARLPLQTVALVLATIGKLIDAAFFLAVLTIWCALHLALWSYAFQLGPAADCFGIPCHDWLSTKVIIGCLVLAVTSYLLARAFRKLGHRATSFMLLMLVTFDVSALLLLGIGSF